MNYSPIVSLLFVQRTLSTVLECSTFTTKVTITPHPPSLHSLPFLAASPVLVNWTLVSSDPLCMDPPRKPKLKRLALGEVSIIFACEDCPKCSVILPDSFEIPIGTKIHSIFILGQWAPHNRARSDIPIYYLEAKQKITMPLKNCRLLLSNTSRFDGMLAGSVAAPLIVFLSVLLLLLIMRYCCCKPMPKLDNNYSSSYAWE